MLFIGSQFLYSGGVISTQITMLARGVARSLSDITQKSILQQRERILQYTLWATALLSTIAYIPSVMIAWNLQLSGLIVVDSLAWLTVVVLALWRTLPFQIKATTFVACWTALSLYLLWLAGRSGAAWHGC